jgi:WD40 repeat protein
VGHQLRRAGYAVELDEWSWRVGTSFLGNMERALARADRMIAILSPAYFQENSYGREEREAALRRAHERDGFLVPVLVAPCDVSPIVGRLSHISLVGCDETAARSRLLDGVRGPQPPGIGDEIPWPGGPPATGPGVATHDDAPFPGAAGAEPKASVVVLHLPEVRRGRPDCPVEVGRLADLVGGDVDRVCVEWGCSPDLVVVTGDVAERGRASEYAQAVRLFDGLLGRWSLPRRRLAVVPGDRDVNRAACRSYFDACEADEVEPIPPYWPKWRHFERMFTGFYGADGPAVFAVGREWSLFPVDELKVVVAGVNSTMSTSHQPGDPQDRIGRAQARWFAERLRLYEHRGWLRIGAVHHHVEAAPATPGGGPSHTRRPALGDMGVRLNLLLSGQVDQESLAGRDEPPVLADTAALGLAAAQYQLLRIDRHGVTRRLRVLTAGGHSWVDGAPKETGFSSAETQGGSRDDRLDRAWAAVSATFPPEPPQDPGENPDGAVEEGRRPQRGPDDRDRFIARVAEVARLRHAGPHGEAHVVEIGPTVDGPGYLRVTCRDGAVVSQHPVGVLDGDPDPVAVEVFARRVHRGYAATDPQLVSDLVYGGAPAGADLVDAAWRQGVRLVSFVAYQGLMDLRGYVAAQTERLDRDPLYPPPLYLPQRFHRLDDHEHRSGDDALAQVVDWLTADEARFVLLLGDFGRGKTFLLHELARTLPDRLPHVVPMLVELRHLEKTHGVDELVAAHLMAAGVSRFDRERFRYMLRNGRVALLFDGFDELALRVTYERAADHLGTLLDALDGQAKIVLTSRSQHFRSDQQVRTALAQRIETLAASRVAGLKDFTDSQVEAFLTRFYDGDHARAAARMALIHDIRDLLGLSRNPRMLGFIARLDETRLRQVQARTGTITSADLYRELLDSWLAHESARARPSGAAPALTTTDRWDALTALAVKLWQTTERTISISELATTTGRVLTTLDAHGLDEGQAAHQIGSGTLLARTGEDTFTFIHASVMEYLLAAACVPQLHGDPGGGDDLLAIRPVSALMADFVVGLAGRDAVLRWARAVLAGPVATHAARANALAFARALDTALPRRASLAEARLPGVDLSGLDLTDADLTGADLTDARLTGTTLQRAVLHRARLTRATITLADLARADLTGAEVNGARLTSCDLTGTNLDGSTWNRAALLGCQFGTTALTGPELQPAAVTGRDQPLLVTQPGARVRAIAISPDGNLLAYAAGSALVLADPRTEILLRVDTSHTSMINSVVFSPDGAALASGGSDGAVRVWDTATGDCRHTLTGHTDGVGSVAFSPDGATVASGSSDGTVRVWDTATGDRRHTLTGHTSAVQSVVYSPPPPGTSPDADPGAPPEIVLASGNSDGTVRIWDTASGDCRHTLTGHTGRVGSVAFSPDGATVASGSADGTVRVWDTANGDCRHTLTGPIRWASAVAFSADGAAVAGGSADGGVRVWDTASGDCRHTLAGRFDWFPSAVFSPDGTLLANGCSDDNTVWVWDTASGGCRNSLAGHTGSINAVRFSADGLLLATSDDVGTARVWDVSSGECRHTLTGHTSRVLSVAFSPDKALLASGSDDHTVRVWDVASGECRHILTGPGETVWSVAFSPEGALIAGGSEDKTVQVWDAASGECRHTLTGHKNRIQSVVFSPDGALLASASLDHTVRLWDTASGECRHILTGHTEWVWSVVFSRDGVLLASGSDDHTLRLWDTASGECRHILTGHANRVRSIAFSPDSTALSSGSDDHTVRVWDVVTGECRHILTGHTGMVRSVAFTPEGRQLGTASADGTVRLWDAHSGQPVAVLAGLRSGGWATLRPDGSYTASGDVADEFWWTINLCRFALGELDPYVNDIRRIPTEEL